MALQVIIGSSDKRPPIVASLSRLQIRTKCQEDPRSQTSRTRPCNLDESQIRRDFSKKKTVRPTPRLHPHVHSQQNALTPPPLPVPFNPPRTQTPRAYLPAGVVVRRGTGMADIDELQSVGSDRSRQSSLASLADDLTKRSTYSHRLGLGLDRALDNFHAPPAAAATATATSTPDNQFLSTAAAVATGTASGFGSFRVPIQSEESRNRLSSLAEAAGDDAEEERAQAPPDAPMLQVCVTPVFGGLVRMRL